MSHLRIILICEICGSKKHTMKARTMKILRGTGLLCGMISLLMATGAPVAMQAQKTSEMQAETFAVTVQYVPKNAAQSVSIAGTFNGWSNTATPLTKQADGKHGASR